MNHLGHVSAGRFEISSFRVGRQKARLLSLQSLGSGFGVRCVGSVLLLFQCFLCGVPTTSPRAVIH